MEAIRSLAYDLGSGSSRSSEATSLRADALVARFEAAVMTTIGDASLAAPSRVVRAALDHAASWLDEAMRAGQPALEGGARRFSLTLGRIMEIALLIRHAQWSKEHERDDRAAAAARRFAASGIDLIGAYDVQDVNGLF